MALRPHLSKPLHGGCSVDHLHVESDTSQTGVIVLLVRGEVDIASAPILREALDAALDDAHREVIVDLNGVTFMDATLLNLLLETNQSARATGATMRVRCHTSHGRRLFTTVGLEHLLD